MEMLVIGIIIGMVASIPVHLLLLASAAKDMDRQEWIVIDGECRLIEDMRE